MQHLLKKILYSIYIIFSLGCGSSKQDYNNIILGSWEVDSMFSYHNGVEKTFIPGEDEALAVGAKTNPRIQKYNAYNEMVDFKINDFDDRLIQQYKIIGDTICFSSNGNSLNWHIDKITTETLIISNVFEMDNKVVTKFFLTKRHNENYGKDIIGEWNAIKMYSNFNGDIEYKIFENGKYIITKDEFITLSNGKTTSSYSYSIKGDSLIAKNWATFYIQRLDKYNLIISIDDSKNPFYQNSKVKSITKLFGNRK